MLEAGGPMGPCFPTFYNFSHQIKLLNICGLLTCKRLPTSQLCETPEIKARKYKHISSLWIQTKSKLSTINRTYTVFKHYSKPFTSMFKPLLYTKTTTKCMRIAISINIISSNTYLQTNTIFIRLCLFLSWYLQLTHKYINQILKKQCRPITKNSCISIQLS